MLQEQHSQNLHQLYSQLLIAVKDLNVRFVLFLILPKVTGNQEFQRNIFCVAASRGKERIIFVNSEEAMLSEKTLSTDVQTSYKFQDVDISGMFDFKYKEDIEECYSLLQVRSLTEPENLSEIYISNKDDLIDLSPCIGIYQEAVFFSGYEIDKSIEFFIDINIDKKFIYSANDRNLTLDKKILFLVSMETKQNRYRVQVDTPFVSESERMQIVDRLGSQIQEKVIFYSLQKALQMLLKMI